MTRRAFPMRKMVRGNGRVLWKGREREEQECSCYLAVLLRLISISTQPPTLLFLKPQFSSSPQTTPPRNSTSSLNFGLPCIFNHEYYPEVHACDVPTQSKPTTPSGADKTHCNKTRSTTI
ncbi:hypothetical protein JMJ77_0001193 [Colletotrichum scovillei]|uniref:Uncharacterized protein n=1 Tax=Colletotrichum scovillei TaxID=1209932 RepID=A0A9P7RAT2_9PEZI|nr:hypothetical protein JMJ77_0001193 [Colletotrichum scovillei]KAG7072418.1 hypothetical protein JMJ76_0005269 [Colletotrichum scovillei]KAG7080636.1 hypothetical protein JMJ78_0007723 [Colletotrichum scovillei]